MTFGRNQELRVHLRRSIWLVPGREHRSEFSFPVHALHSRTSFRFTETPRPALPFSSQHPAHGHGQKTSYTKELL